MTDQITCRNGLHLEHGGARRIPNIGASSRGVVVAERNVLEVVDGYNRRDLGKYDMKIMIVVECPSGTNREYVLNTCCTKVSGNTFVDKTGLYECSLLYSVGLLMVLAEDE